MKVNVTAWVASATRSCSFCWIWRPVGSPGVVLHDGRLAGLWRGRKQGRKLTFEAEWLGAPVDVTEEMERLAALRGAVYEVA